MFRLLIGFVVGLAVAAMYPEAVASQLARIQGVFNTVNVKTAELPRPVSRETETLPPLTGNKGAGATPERTPPVPGNADPALEYQTRSERRAVNAHQWLELYEQIFKSQEGQ